MFEQYATAFWIVLFAGLVLYGLWRSILAPLQVRRFYSNNGFHTEAGEDHLEQSPYGDSLLLAKLQPGPIYTGEYRGHRIEQFAASMRLAGSSMFNHAKRRKEHHAWTITVLHSELPLPAFCARPTKARDSMEYLLNTDNVMFPDDELFANKIHVLADDHPQLIAAFTPSVREWLDGIDAVSLEAVGEMLVLKTPRQPHDTGSKLRSHLDAAVMIHEAITSAVQNPQT